MKQDKRIQHTKKFVQDALLELIQKKPLSMISVTELCERATVNRNTFYCHYNTPRDVLDELSAPILEEIQTAISDTGNQRDATLNSCRIMKQNESLCRILFSDNSESNMVEKIISLAQTRSLSLMKRDGSRFSENYQQMVSAFTVSGGAAIVRTWVRNGMQETPEEISDLVHTLCYRGTGAFTKKG